MPLASDHHVTHSTAGQGMDFVRTLESPSFEDSYFSRRHNAVLMDQLEKEVEDVYRKFYRIYSPQMSSTSLPNSQTSYEEKCEANAKEFVTATPLTWPMRNAFAHVWTLLDNSSDRSRKPNTLESNAKLTVPLRNSTACQFHKLHLLRKYEEQDRIIVIWSDLMQITSKGIRLRSIAHAVLAPSEPTRRTLVSWRRLLNCMWSQQKEKSYPMKTFDMGRKWFFVHTAGL
ncbi:uncharacterized protein PITG_09167 [Phytophthora infestans T30-4]|uniref:Uncharacterized protein n=1 Tax=Phytophthora infestans (strain T30-4) TaxID=403677 RepID=D0NBV0_PHYIT|nr:uncharacterized protein PITG_09167 [Phytophthora infestans T30-4]EEY55255.1 conserved hypothetical protein [Phytophthora infestans T30-4]|eukprot:XP_002903479.1 conserved hypothetical protein [Phytophthora infestans T30-4]